MMPTSCFGVPCQETLGSRQVGGCAMNPACRTGEDSHRIAVRASPKLCWWDARRVHLSREDEGVASPVPHVPVRAVHIPQPSRVKSRDYETAVVMTRHEVPGLEQRRTRLVVLVSPPRLPGEWRCRVCKAWKQSWSTSNPCWGRGFRVPPKLLAGAIPLQSPHNRRGGRSR